MHTSSLQPPPPQVNPSWLCYPVLMSVRSPLLPCSALFLTASQTHAVTQPHSLPAYSRSCRQVLVPSLFALRSFIPAHHSAAYGRPACSEANLMSRHTSPTHFSKHSKAYMQHVNFLSAISTPLVAILLCYEAQIDQFHHECELISLHYHSHISLYLCTCTSLSVYIKKLIHLGPSPKLDPTADKMFQCGNCSKD